MNFWVRNIHPAAGETALRELFARFGPVKEVVLESRGSPDRKAAIVAMSVSHAEADVMLRHLDNALWEGRHLQITRLLFFSDGIT